MLSTRGLRPSSGPSGRQVRGGSSDLALASRVRASHDFIPQGTRAGREQERSRLRSSTCQSVRKGICFLLQQRAQP